MACPPRAAEPRVAARVLAFGNEAARSRERRRGRWRRVVPVLIGRGPWSEAPHRAAGKRAERFRAASSVSVIRSVRITPGASVRLTYVARAIPTRRASERSERMSGGRFPASRKRAPDDQCRRRPDLPAVTHDARGASWRPSHIALPRLGPSARDAASAAFDGRGISSSGVAAGVIQSRRAISWTPRQSGCQCRKGARIVSDRPVRLQRIFQTDAVALAESRRQADMACPPRAAGWRLGLGPWALGVGRWAFALRPLLCPFPRRPAAPRPTRGKMRLRR